MSEALALFLLSLLILVLCYALSIAFSYVLSVVLNKAVWRQLENTAHGDDLPSEVSITAHANPRWMPNGTRFLPEELADEISSIADRAAAKSLSKFRSAVSQLASAQTTRQDLDMFSEYLTWDELIHTAYFKVPRFRKLVAYAISQCEGFRPTEAFKSDPDYDLVAKWYEELRAPEGKASQSAA